MVEANADPEVVTAIIRRETHDARAAKPASEVPSAPLGRSSSSPPAPSVASVAVAPPPAAPAAETSGVWNAQFILALVIVGVLLVVWIAERRSRREGADEDAG